MDFRWERDTIADYSSKKDQPVRLALLIAVAAMVAGCASSIMQGFVGQPIQQVALRYGPPSNVYDMPDGQRAFQWVRINSYTTPTQVNTTGSAFPIGNMVWYSQNTTVTGGQPVRSECAYTLLARWNGDAWIVASFVEPRLLCQ